jgi:uncharacterized cupin superfamily protein
MADHTVRRIDDMEAVAFGAMKRARAELGVTSFGLQIIDLPPNADRYPEHDHSHDGQEEVYVALRGAGEVEIEGERHPLDGDTVLRVGPAAKRKVYAGADGLRVLCIGGVPGAAYQVMDYTELGAPDPFAS